jgi:hypothetical protein
MNDEMIADLKQFIAATVSQQLSGVATKDDIAELKNEITGIKGDIARIEGKIDDLAADVAEALSTSNDAFEEQIEKRLQEHVRQYHHA